MVKTKMTLASALAVVTLSASLLFGIGGVQQKNGAVCAVSPGDKLIAGGMAFGIKVNTNGVIIIDTSAVNGAKSPAALSGLRRGDIIIKIGEKSVLTAKDLVLAIESEIGEVDISYIRDGKERRTTVRPALDEDGKGRIGVLVRDSAAGIGTITYIDPVSMSFAGLGHGICDKDNGKVLPIIYGSAENVNVTGINIGKAGAPGEIRGAFTGRRIGKIVKNSETGVYGVLSELPNGADALYESASADEICDGRAYVRSSVGGTPELYEIEIKIISRGKDKNLSVRVTDERLIALTGGIVQGMSGSPIIQNGKLIGAITHVLIGDPAEGYGIFLCNMLDNAVMSYYEDSAA